MKCVVTGAAGQVGTHLVSLLAQKGHAVTAFDRVAPESGGAAKALAGDICDTAALDQVLAEGYEVVFHLAGLNALQPEKDLLRVNVEGTQALLAALKRRPPCCVVLMSSSAVYGPAQDNPIVETSPLDPQTPYARSKVAAEAAARQLAEGLDIRIARPFNIIGPGQRAPLLYNKVAAQLMEIAHGTRAPALQLGNLDAFRDVIDVRDVCEGLVAIAESGRAGEAYNLCSGAATTMAEIVEKLVALSSLTVAVATAPRTSADVPYQRGSYEKLNAASGWAPKVNLEASLRDTLDWWDHLAGGANSA